MSDIEISLSDALGRKVLTEGLSSLLDYNTRKEYEVVDITVEGDMDDRLVVSLDRIKPVEKESDE